MSEIKNGGLDQYGAEPFEQRQFGTAGVEGVNFPVPATIVQCYYVVSSVSALSPVLRLAHCIYFLRVPVVIRRPTVTDEQAVSGGEGTRRFALDRLRHAAWDSFQPSSVVSQQKGPSVGMRLSFNFVNV